MSPPRILITGSTGQVGSAIFAALPQDRYELHAPQRATFDLTSPDSMRAYIRELRPRWIINPAAYTAVDKAESEPDLAYAINRDAVQTIGEEAQRIGASVIHFSTDYVFDGTGASPYTESDPTNPVSVYGASKLAGEQALTRTGASHLVLRTSWVYASTGKNFLLTILRLAAQKPELKIVADQHGAPTSAIDLAALTAHVLALDPDLTQLGGVYHATAAGETTWHGFAAEAVSQAHLLSPETSFASLLPIPTSDYPTPATRPANSRLNCSKLQSSLGFSFPLWATSLSEVLAQFYNPAQHD